MFTVETDDIVHMSSRTVTILSRIDQEDVSAHPSETAQGAQTGRATSDDNRIVGRVVARRESCGPGKGQQGAQGNYALHVDCIALDY